MCQAWDRYRFVGFDGTRIYSAPPILPDSSALARMQVRAWSDLASRNSIARAMYKHRFDETPPAMPIRRTSWHGSSRMRAAYPLIAKRFGVTWKKRIFDRDNPLSADEEEPGCEPRGYGDTRAPRSRPMRWGRYHNSASSTKTVVNLSF